MAAKYEVEIRIDRIDGNFLFGNHSYRIFVGTAFVGKIYPGRSLGDDGVVNPCWYAEIGSWSPVVPFHYETEAIAWVINSFQEVCTDAD